MPEGTRSGYLLFYLFLQKAKSDGIKTITIGTGVDKKSATRNLDAAMADKAEADTAENNRRVAEAKRSRAAVAIYEALGFDPTDAVSLSKSVLPIDDVLNRCRAKLVIWKEFVGGGGNCFLTTACVVTRQLPDDCEQLTVLRAFRDNYVQHLPAGKEIIEHYYRIAPAIVAAIKRDAKRSEIFDAVFQVVCECVLAIKERRFGRALKLYRAMVRELERRFAISLESLSNDAIELPSAGDVTTNIMDVNLE